MSIFDPASLLARAASGEKGPDIAEALRSLFAGLGDADAVELLTALDTDGFCRVVTEMPVLLDPDRQGMLLSASHRIANRARAEGRHADARRLFEATLRLDPGDINVRYAIAQYMEQAGQLADIYELMRHGIAGLDHPPAWLLFARAALSVGDTEAAALHVERLAALAPFSDPALAGFQDLRTRVIAALGLERLTGMEPTDGNILPAVKAAMEAGWPPALGSLLSELAIHPQAGEVVRAMDRLHRRTLGPDTAGVANVELAGAGLADAGCERDARLLLDAGAVDFLAEALGRIASLIRAGSGSEPPEWLGALHAQATAERLVDPLLAGLSQAKGERDAVWHLRRLAKLAARPQQYAAVLTPARAAALADGFVNCRGLDRFLAADARRLLRAAAGAGSDTVVALVRRLRDLGQEAEADGLLRIALARPDAAPDLIRLRLDSLTGSETAGEAADLRFRLSRAVGGTAAGEAPEEIAGQDAAEPSDLEALGDRLAEEGRIDTACAAYGAALHRAGDGADTELRRRLLLKRGDLLLRLGDAAAARTSYKAAYRERPAPDAVERLLHLLSAAGAADTGFLPAEGIRQAAERTADEIAADAEDRRIQENNRILYFISWHSDPSSLVRLLGAIHDDLNYYFISVGGTSSPEDVDRVLPLLQADNIFLFNGAPAAWGGRKLLFENVFAAIDFLLAALPACRWMQVLCNQCYPLLSQNDIRRMLSGDEWPDAMHGVPPPTYRESYYATDPADFTVLHDKVHGVFRRADTEGFDFPDAISFSGPSYAFNFSGQSQDVTSGFKSTRHNYKIKPYGVDFREMSGGRYVEFTDAMDDGNTYTQLLAPHHAQAIHSILKKYEIRTGDPFVLMSRDHAEYLKTSEVAHELYLAMANQFAPEMNYFDTVRQNSPFKKEPAHPFCRGKRLDLMVEEDDIDLAVGSSKFFIRKLVREHGIGFIRHFGRRIAAERPEAAMRWSLTLGAVASAEPAPLRRLDRLIAWPGSAPWDLRDLKRRLLVRLLPRPDGTVQTESGHLFGHWRWTEDGALDIHGDDGTKQVRYRRLTAADGRLVLIPEALVWVGTDWGRFLEQPVETAWQGGRAAPDSIRLPLSAADLQGPEAVLRQASTELNATLAGLSNVADDPMVPDVTRLSGLCEHIARTADGRILARFVLDEAVLVLRLCRAVLTGGHPVLVFAQGTAEEYDLSFQLPDGIALTFDQAALTSGAWRIRSRRHPQWRSLRFDADGRVRVEGSGTAGWAGIMDGRLVLMDVADWALCELPQVAWTEDGWHLTGYGQYDLSEDDYIHLVRTGD